MNKERYQAKIAKLRELHKNDVCEFCGKEHDHTYGSGRFCSATCKIRHIASSNRGANNPNVIAHLEKLRAEGKIAARAPYGTWYCKICEDHPIFNTRAQLQQHESECHNRKRILINDTECPYCGKRFETCLQTKGHLTSCPKHPNRKEHDEAHRKAGRTYAERSKLNPRQNYWFGRHHTKETREKLSIIRSRQVMNEFLPKVYVHTKWYKVNNIKGEEFSVRGTWEVNVSKRLNDLGIYWTKAQPIPYETDIVHHYTPDFFIPDRNIYIEVKGRYPDSDKLKMRLVLQQHPELKIYFIHNQYKDFVEGRCDFDDKLLMTIEDTV